MTNSQPSPQEAAQELLARRAARQSLIDFTCYTKPDFQVGEHHKQIAEALEAVERGDVDRLMIFAPPRHTKSELASRRFPAWYLGRHPDRQVIAATYSGDFALDFGREVRGIVQGEEFRALYPDVALAQDSQAANRWHTNQGGVSVYVGVGGPITGRGAHIALIDDPFKNREEADSEVRRETVWRWYTSTLRTRLMPGGAIVLIMTRWHEDDLAGRLLAKQPDEWRVIEFQAIAKEGTSAERALWPGWYDLAALKRIKADIGQRDWAALYQQRPTVAEGTFFKREWFRRYTQEQLPKSLHRYITSDHAPAGEDDSDYSCVRVWGVCPAGDLYLLDGFRHQETLDKTADRVIGNAKEGKRGLIQRHKPFAWFPEDDNNWKSAHGFITRLMREQKVFCRIEPMSPHGSDKPTKAQPFQAMAASGRVWLPVGPEGDDVLEQYLKFPAGKNDDECLIAGTLILMADGSGLEIEKVRAGDFVMTPNGAREVTASAMTNACAEVLSLTLESGHSIVGTAGHPIMTESGVVRMDAIGDNARVITLEHSCLKSKFATLRVVLTGATQRANICTTVATSRLLAVMDFYIGTFGKRRTDQSQPACKSIMSTETLLTIDWKTWSASAQRNIVRTTSCAAKFWRDRWSTLLRSAQRLANGTGRMKEETGTAGTQKMVGSRGGIGNSLVDAVAASFQLGTLATRSFVLKPALSGFDFAVQIPNTNRLCAPNSAAPSAGLSPTRKTPSRRSTAVSCASRAVGAAKRLPERAAVYNISVDGEHVYFANGVLVHNCDAAAIIGRALDMAHPAIVEHKEELKKLDSWDRAFGGDEEEDNWKTA